MSDQQLKDFGGSCRDARRDPRLRGARPEGTVTFGCVVGWGSPALWQWCWQWLGSSQTPYRGPAKDEPIKLPHLHSDARPYRAQGPHLDEGTYWLRPSLLDSHLATEFTVPRGWDGSWVGPQAVGDWPGHKSWYANALIMEVDHVGTHGCMPDTTPLETPEEVVDALRQAWSTKLVREPAAERRFGFPATRMRLGSRRTPRTCPDQANATFHTTQDGYIPFAPHGTLLDIWVVDVDGRPIYVQRAHTPNTPPGAHRRAGRRDRLHPVQDPLSDDQARSPLASSPREDPPASGGEQAGAGLRPTARGSTYRTSPARHPGSDADHPRVPSRATAASAVSSTVRIRPPECTSCDAQAVLVLARRASRSDAVGAQRVHAYAARHLGARPTSSPTRRRPWSRRRPRSPAPGRAPTARRC